MAKIHEESIVIKFSRLRRDEETEFAAILTEEMATALEQVAQELAGAEVIVEISG